MRTTESSKPFSLASATAGSRAEPLRDVTARLYLSPVTLLELAYLVEVGRLQAAPGGSLMDIADDPRWTLDDVPPVALFRAAIPITWTRNPFDRLLVAHTRHRRWRLATGDRHLAQQLGDALAL